MTANNRSVGLISVVVPCLGSLDAIRATLNSVFRHTHGERWELILVVVGAGNAKKSYLNGIRDASSVSVSILSDPTIKSVADALCRGLGVAIGDFVCFLLPSMIVTDGWLNQLHALAELDPSIALVGPMSNSASQAQRAESDLPLEEPSKVDQFAIRWRTERRGRWRACEFLAMRCLLARRRYLDGDGTRGPVRPNELRSRRLASRVRRLGGRVVLAQDLYVHRASPQLRSPESAPPFVAAPPEVARCRVSLTMIVRDEEKNLPACLESIAGLFDEIVVVDTGSTDQTVEIARSFNANVVHFAWVDDFSAARNVALSYAVGEYAFWLDADDRLEASEKDKLASLLRGLRKGDEAAYVLRCTCDPDQGGGGATVVDHVRLFPIRDEIRWTYRVHEQVLPSIRGVGLPVRWTDILIRHVGYVDSATRARKLDRDYRLLGIELAARPSDPFVLFNLGAVAMERGEFAKAIPLLRLSLAGSAPSDSITRKLRALLARAHQSLGDTTAALAICVAGLRQDPDDAELLFRKGMVHRARGESSSARCCWEQVRSLRRPLQFASLDMEIYGHLTSRNLAILAEEGGDPPLAIEYWRDVLSELPQDRAALESLSRLGRIVGDHG